jgi:DNA adenine methylase
MGNKKEIAPWVISFFPPHKTYVEVFGGTMQILLHKSNSEVEIYNDVNTYLTNLFETIRTSADKFISEFMMLPISEDLYNAFYEKLPTVTDDFEKAVLYFYIMTFAHRGKFTGGFFVAPEKSYTSKLENKVQLVQWMHERLRKVIILNKSFEKIVTANNKSDTLLYLDPPYVKTESYYAVAAGDFTEHHHILLRDLLKKHTGKFVLSYEDDPVVTDLYSDFYIYNKNKFRQGKGDYAEEVIVTNFKHGGTLFDLEK